VEGILHAQNAFTLVVDEPYGYGMSTSSMSVERAEITVGAHHASYLTAGDGPLVLLLHGTYWSRVWQPVIGPLAERGLQPVAVDLPGVGRSGGELTPAEAGVPALARWVLRFLEALGDREPVAVIGHDIGGAIAQHLTVHANARRLALVNSVTYDSWPVPGVARFRDPDVVAGIGVEEIVSARRQAVTKALAMPVSDALVSEYVAPWTELRVARSWMALAGATDCRFTMELVDALRRSSVPKLLVWGEDDEFQPVTYAERFAEEMPNCRLVRIPRAGHIPMENDAGAVAAALADFAIGG
jgi:pimeloyl-ACP methyl ester carboxylesterase